MLRMPAFSVSAFALLVSMAFSLSSDGSNMMGRQSQNEGIFVVPAPGPVKIDGNLDDWDWSGRIWVFSDVALREQYSVEVAAMWDADSLYLAAKWKDPTPMFNQINPAFDPNLGWTADAWQIRLLTDHTLHLTSWFYTAERRGAIHISRSPQGVGGDTFVLIGGPDEQDLGRGAQMAFRKHEDGRGYDQEIRIPWTLVYNEPPPAAPGLTFRMGNEFFWGDASGKIRPSVRYADNMQPGATSREFYWRKTDVWGDATLVAAGGLERRAYIYEHGRLKGTIPVRVQLPQNATHFTVVIEDAEGRRVRNLAGNFDPLDYTIAIEGDRRTVEVLWDGLDDRGELVEAGSYMVRGLHHRGLRAAYEQTFYNPGTPPWDIPDGSGSWMSDHSPPLNVTAGKTMVAVSANEAEGGSGIIGIGPDGRKRWGEKRGGLALAADATHLYAITKSTYAKGALNRFDLETGHPRPFKTDAGERPFDLKMDQILPEAGEAVALASRNGTLAVSLSNNRLALLDAASAMPRRVLDAPAAASLAFAPDGKLHAILDGRVQRLDMETGAVAEVATPGLGFARGLAFDASGNLVLADAGPDSQIKIYSPEGKFLRAIGTKGGRPRSGRFDPGALMKLSSVAVDGAGQIWAVENWNDPRRVSVWTADGKLIRDYIGNTGYAATNTYLHDEDPDLAYVGSVEMKLNRADRTYQVSRVLWAPDYEENEAFPLWNRVHNFPNPKFLVSKAGGTTRRYLYFNGVYSHYHAIYMEKEDAWQPVAALAHVGNLPEPIRSKLFGDVGDKAAIFWNDNDGNGKISREESIVVPDGLALRAGWGQLPGEDLSIYADGRVRYRPLRFTASGAPVYGPDGIEHLTHKGNGEVVPVDEENLLLVLGLPLGRGQPGSGLKGVDRETGVVRWSYPDPYPGVQGSHRAPMPEPGMLIGTLRMMGVAHVNKTVGRVFAVRGNLGQDSYLTTDGLFIGSVFQDTRMPTPPFPETEDELSGMPMELFKIGGEPFSGWFGRQRDGAFRIVAGILAGRQAGMIMRIEGLDAIERFAGPGIHVDEPMLTAAAADNEARNVAVGGAASHKIPRMAKPPRINGDPRDWQDIEPMKIVRPGFPEEGTVRLAYDEKNFYALFEIRDRSPWRNKGGDFRRLFKTGDAVDVQFNVLPGSQVGSRDLDAGDRRVLIAPMDGKPVAVLMQPISPDAPPDVAHVYESPVQPRPFDRVEIVAGAKVSVKVGEDGCTIEAALPLDQLGLKPQPGMSVRGDVGFISSDEAGLVNVARTYWANKETNLVNDEPGEAWLQPARWGTWIFQ